MSIAKLTIQIPQEIKDMMDLCYKNEFRSINSFIANCIKFYIENKDKIMIDKRDISFNISIGATQELNKETRNEVMNTEQVAEKDDQQIKRTKMSHDNEWDIKKSKS